MKSTNVAALLVSASWYGREAHTCSKRVANEILLISISEGSHCSGGNGLFARNQLSIITYGEAVTLTVAVRWYDVLYNIRRRLFEIMGDANYNPWYCIVYYYIMLSIVTIKYGVSIELSTEAVRGKWNYERKWAARNGFIRGIAL